MARWMGGWVDGTREGGAKHRARDMDVDVWFTSHELALIPFTISPGPAQEGACGAELEAEVFPRQIRSADCEPGRGVRVLSCE